MTSTNEPLEIRVGSFAVVKRRFSSWPVVEVQKVTAKQVKASGEWSSRAHTYRVEEIVFCGTKEAATALSQQLVSSEALCGQEQRASYQRREERNAKLIEEARNASR